METSQPVQKVSQVTTKSLLFFLHAMEPGGAERVFVDYTNEAIKKGYKVTLVLVKAKGGFLYKLNKKVRIVDLNLPKIRYAVWPLIKVIIKENPKFIISQLGGINLVALVAAFLSGSKARRIAIQGSSLTRHRGQRPSLWRLLTLSAHHLADIIICPSDGVRKDLARWVKLPSRKLAVCNNPLDLSAIDRARKEHIDHPWLSHDQDPVILGIGRLVEQKNFSMLIRAFAIVRKERLAKLIILGDGPLRKALHVEVRELGLNDAVFFNGYTDNPYAFLERSQVFVLSSEWESFGIVLTEALACGCPVVSTSCPWGPSEILENGKFGALVSADDVGGMAKAIVKMLDSPPTKNYLIQRASHFESGKCFEHFELFAGLR